MKTLRATVRRTRPEGREGMVLLWAVLVSVAVLASTFTFFSVSMASKRISDANRDRTRADYLSRAATVHAAEAIRVALGLDDQPPEQGTQAVGDDVVAYSIERVDGPTLTTDESALNPLVSVYRIEGTATVGGVTSLHKRVVLSRVVALFQFALFYETPMNFLYNAPMTINGRVHCNSDLYIYQQAGLTFNTNYVRTAGNLYSKLMFPEWGEAYPWGDNLPASFRRWVADPFDPTEPVEYALMETESDLDALSIPNESGFDSTFAGYDADGDGDFYGLFDWLPFAARALEIWSEPDLYSGGSGATVLTSEHGVERVEAPEFGSFAMYEAVEDGDHVYDADEGVFVEVAPGSGTHAKGPYHEKAGLTILSLEGGGWQAFSSAGVDVTDELSRVVETDELYDARQAEGSGEAIQLTKIDVGLLNESGLFPANGLLYVGGYGAGEGTDVKGFQLHNGAELKAPLSVVSPDSVYIQGDYNTEATQPAAVMADAVNLLSNAWDETKTPGTLPEAADTSYHTAILTGETEATADNFNGGPHNLPRFHEKWTGKDCRVVGSMVCLGESERATGEFFVGGDYYRPPVRKWGYDPRFNDYDQLPPFTPVFVEIDDIAVW